MKKLMFALTAVAATVAMADVVSSNIVGYQNQGVQKYQLVSATFTGVDGKENFKLGDLKTNCDEAGEVSSGWVEVLDAVVELDNQGTYKRKFVYVPEWYADGEEYSKGWYDSTDGDFKELLDEKVDLPFGYGYPVSISGVNGQEIQCSGAVKPGPTIINLSAGYKIIGNCACKELYLKDLVTNCDETGESSAGWVEVLDAVVELDNQGTFSRKFVYVPEWYADGEEYSKGWYDSTDGDFKEELGSKVKFIGGGAFPVSISGSNGQMITIKSALATDAE